MQSLGVGTGLQRSWGGAREASVHVACMSQRSCSAGLGAARVQLRDLTLGQRMPFKVCEQGCLDRNQETPGRCDKAVTQ